MDKERVKKLMKQSLEKGNSDQLRFSFNLEQKSCFTVEKNKANHNPSPFQADFLTHKIINTK